MPIDFVGTVDFLLGSRPLSKINGDKSAVKVLLVSFSLGDTIPLDGDGNGTVENNRIGCGEKWRRENVRVRQEDGGGGTVVALEWVGEEDAEGGDYGGWWEFHARVEPQPPRPHAEIVVISGVFSVVWVLRRMDLRGGTVHRVSATRVANAREKRV